MEILSIRGAARSGTLFRDPQEGDAPLSFPSHAHTPDGVCSAEEIEPNLPSCAVARAHPAMTEGTVAFTSPLHANTPYDVCLAGDPEPNLPSNRVARAQPMTEGTVAFTSPLHANTPDDVCLAGAQPTLTEGTVAHMSRARPTTEGTVTPLGAPINPDLRTHLERCSYLTPGLRQMIYDAGLTNHAELKYLRAICLPTSFPYCKLARLLDDLHTEEQGVGADPGVHPSSGYIPQLDLGKHWGKMYDTALKMVRDCPSLPKEGVFDPTSLAWSLYQQSLADVFDLVSDPVNPQAPSTLKSLMQAICLNPIPSLESHSTVKAVVDTGSDALLCRVLTKTLPDAFLQRVLGTAVFTSKSGIRLYYYLCNTTPHDRSQRLLSLRKTLYAQVGCKDKTKLASVLQMWYSMYLEIREDGSSDSLDDVQLLGALKTLVAPQLYEELRGLTLAQHLANELAVIRRLLRTQNQPLRDMTLEEYFNVCREFAIDLQATMSHSTHANSFQALLGHATADGD